MTRRTVRTAAFALVIWASVASPLVVRGDDSSQPKYPDSAAGLQAQFVDIVLASRSHDQTGLRAAIESLAIPNAEQWFATNFDPQVAGQLVQEYPNALSGFQSHVYWVLDFAKFSDFGLTIQPSEIPRPPADSGLESLLPWPVRPVNIENFRFSAVKPSHGPPSWVSSFVYIDGRFRFVGGTYPFWAEKLGALRGPMAMPVAVIRGMPVQGVAYYDEPMVSSIAAVVRLEGDVARKGKVSHIKVLSGEEPFISDAMEYLKRSNFDAMPKVRGLNGKVHWDIAVIFFKPKGS